MSWLDRQSFLGADSDDVLRQTKVGIVGLGGGGSHVAQQFAHVGIGRFVLTDADRIEDTNLNRLVGGTQEDVEKSRLKVEIAKRLILAVRPDADVQASPVRWQEVADDLKSCDVIVGGLDSVTAKAELDAFCRRFLVPYVDMGMDVHGEAPDFLISGQVVLSSPDGPCLRCYGVVTDDALTTESTNYGAAGGKPQVVWPNGLLASSAVGLVLQLITPWHSRPVSSAYLEYDGNLNTLTESHRLAILRKRGCSHFPADERGDPGFDIRTFLEDLSRETKTMEPSTAHRPKAVFSQFLRRIKRLIGLA